VFGCGFGGDYEVCKSGSPTPLVIKLLEAYILDYYYESGIKPYKD